MTTDTARTYHAVVCPWCFVQMVIRRAATDADNPRVTRC